MSTTLQLVELILNLVSIIFMICFMFIGIWSFIVFLKMAKNQRLQTFLLEKINRSISSLEKSITKDKLSLNTDFLTENLTSNEDNNIINFDDNIK